jgi:hypothetical protein
LEHQDQEVLRFELPHDENQKLPPMENIEQYYIDQLLLNAAEKRADLMTFAGEPERQDFVLRNTARRSAFPHRNPTTRCMPIGWCPAMAVEVKCEKRWDCSFKA